MRLGRLAVAAGGLLALTAAVVPLVGGSRSVELPTARVERLDFVRRVPAEGTLAAARATPLSVPPAVNGPVRIAWTAPDGSPVETGDPVVRFDPTELEETLVNARADLATNDARVRQERVTSESELVNLGRDADIARLERETAERFQKRDELIYSRAEIIESEIDGELAAERQRNASAARAARQSLAGTELELLDIERRGASLRIARAEESLESLAVRAPHDGIVVLRRDRRGNPPRVGDTTWPGQPLAEIPELGEMQAEVWVLEADAGGLVPGLAAEVVVEAHPETRHPAKVARVDSLAKPRVPGSPVQYFAVTLELAATDPATMKPGQRVRAVIELEQRAAALVVPLQAVFERDGAQVVFRRAGDGFEPVAVELGPLSAGRVVIESGLAAGDEVALADPQRTPAPPAAAGDTAAAGGSPLGGALR